MSEIHAIIEKTGGKLNSQVFCFSHNGNEGISSPSMRCRACPANRGNQLRNIAYLNAGPLPLRVLCTGQCATNHLEIVLKISGATLVPQDELKDIPGLSGTLYTIPLAVNGAIPQKLPNVHAGLVTSQKSNNGSVHQVPQDYEFKGSWSGSGVYESAVFSCGICLSTEP